MAQIFQKNIDIDAYGEDLLLGLHRMMWRIRKFDQNLIRLMQEGKVSGFYHSGIGSEGLSAGAMVGLRADDYLFYNHRGCNQMIAKGIPLSRLYGDFLGTLEGTTGGLGAGIVHSSDMSLGVVGQAGTIGSQFSIGVGTGLSAKWRKTDQVTAIFFGEGAASEEALHGSLNWAALHRLPIVYFCENNEYAISSHWTETHAVREHIADWADGYGIPNCVVDGNDPLLMMEVANEAIARARSGGGPTFIEARTFRHRGHYEGDPVNYIDKDVLRDWIDNRDPIKNFESVLLQSGRASDATLKRIAQEVDDEVAAAIAKAEAAPLPDKDRIFQGLYS